MQNQNKVILSFLRKKPITTLDAFRLGITRLSARIYDLRKQGFKIAADRIRVRSRWGKTTVCRYSLERTYGKRSV